MSNKPKKKHEVVEVTSKTISITVKGRQTATGPIATSTGTRMSDLTDVLHLLSDKPLFRPKPRRLSREP